MYFFLDTAPSAFSAAGGYVPLVLLGFVGVFALVGLLKGLSRGFGRQLFRTFTVALSALISYFVCSGLYPKLYEQIEGKSVEDIIAMMGDVGGKIPENVVSYLSYLDVQSTASVGVMLLALFIIPFLFTAMFFVISALLYIVYGIVTFIAGMRKKGKGGLSRLFGMLVGAVQGAAVAVLWLLPVFGIFGVMNATAAALPEDNEYVSAYTEVAEPVCKSPVYTLSMKLGGQKLLDGLTAVPTADGKTVQALDEYKSILAVVDKADSLMDGEADFLALRPEDEAALDEIIAAIADDDFLLPIVTSVLRSGAALLSENLDVIGMEESDFKDVILSALDVFRTSDEDNFESDFATFTEAYYLLSDTGTLKELTKEDADASAVLSKKDEHGETVLKKCMSILNSNPRTAPIVTALTKFSVSMVSASAGLDVEVYEEFKESVNDLLEIDLTQDKETVAAEVAPVLDEALQKANIVLEPEVLDEMSGYVADFLQENAETFEGLEELSDADFNEIILTYFDAYASKLG